MIHCSSLAILLHYPLKMQFRIAQKCPCQYLLLVESPFLLWSYLINDNDSVVTAIVDMNVSNHCVAAVSKGSQTV